MSKSLLNFILLLPFVAGAQVSDSAQRVVKLAGATNMRDLGGYHTTDGRSIKWGKLYRSADISKLTNADLDTFRQRKIVHIVDLRGVNESKAAPDRVNPNTDYILCPAGSDQNMTDWMKTLQTLNGSGDSMMINYYSNTQFLVARFKPFFGKLFALPNNDALLFHCTAGKDRTGIGTALLLYALGVPQETIVDDYLASNVYREKSNEKMVQQMVQTMHITKQVATDVASVKKEYLNATFNAINKQYGSIDNFLNQPLELNDDSIKILKEKFLQ